MSNGRTGLILRVWAEVVCGNSVKVMYAESYETSDEMKCVEGCRVMHQFPSKFRAHLYAAHVTAGKLKRYSGTKYSTHFTSGE